VESKRRYDTVSRPKSPGYQCSEQLGEAYFWKRDHGRGMVYVDSLTLLDFRPPDSGSGGSLPPSCLSHISVRT